ncbi:mobilome CxxCx(11)CxxC protein [Vibrio parahaemolyticus]|uniref:mobilome CxxCx(11)CxxC protein n=1 Tax=Vibrio parahaemolyticus TaxID=670 RepID=UPI001D16438E|nr:mobilome CxxCx(11)CxxC protein [Vibrio parahaemolyticus]MCC3789033.1 hypothetical protein [Vibrio parahaemolyticus]MCC3836613.1 hypothetical protein [Vibrio parahaemolyticus]MCC3841284.1 hypothetical protein [Vibrio parahaemolyticus]
MTIEEIHESCREKEFHAYGTARLFEERAEKIRGLRTKISFLGIINPLLIGCVVITFGVKETWLPAVLLLSGLLSTVQLVLSVWSMAARWDEIYDFSINSVKENTELKNAFKALQKNKSRELPSLYRSTMEKNERRELSDLTQNITNKEKRFANRESLRYYQYPCQTCHIVPIKEKPSNCDSCGNY